MVKEISDEGEFERETSGPGLVVVDFFTTWCGPCKQIAPFVESLVDKYPEVKFVKVDIEKLEDLARARNISSIPTFHFILKGKLVDEMKGANPTELEAKVVQYKVQTDPFGGSSGFKLAGDVDPNAPALSAREARLKAFAAMEGPKRVVEAKKGEDCDDDEALSKALSLSLAAETTAPTAPAPSQASAKSGQDADEYAAAEAEFAAAEQLSSAPQHFQEAAGQEWEEEMVPVPVNEELLAQLLEMGFSDVRARKSLVHGGSLDGAVAWLSEHGEDDDIDQPYLVRLSDTIPKPPLTEEEKAERSQNIRNIILKRKQEAVKQEKVDAIRLEKERRERGQKMEQTQDERQRAQRKRDADKAKKEKDDANKERSRLRAEIAKDKEVRRANKGVLPSVLGVDGYNPSIIQYDLPASASASAGASAGGAVEGEASVPAKRSSDTSAAAPIKSAPAAKKPAPASASSSTSSMSPAQRVDSAIGTILKYRTGGDGGSALKLLSTFVKNVAENPDEPKYKSISTESNAYKNKLAQLVGPLLLLRAVGFNKGVFADDEGKLKFEG
ncbi:hypothetical protein B484DRAFT_405513 [Ochromonadaceae sp. CCMP2298]|nr:hypothetical protein B484DRAFT_405513 [Ochromonadaceae sp. CCMP2298]